MGKGKITVQATGDTPFVFIAVSKSIKEEGSRSRKSSEVCTVRCLYFSDIGNLKFVVFEFMSLFLHT